MRGILAASLVGLLMTSSAVFADDQNAAPTGAPSITAAALALAATTDASTVTENAAFVRRFQASQHRPLMLPALYGTAAFLQGYDAYSTLTVLKHGGVEANPVMKGVTKNPAAFIGLKAGVTMMSIMAAERMWKNHNRVGAIATMIVSNGLMTAVAANNARVLSQLR